MCTGGCMWVSHPLPVLYLKGAPSLCKIGAASPAGASTLALDSSSWGLALCRCLPVNLIEFWQGGPGRGRQCAPLLVCKTAVLCRGCRLGGPFPLPARCCQSGRSQHCGLEQLKLGAGPLPVSAGESH